MRKWCVKIVVESGVAITIATMINLYLIDRLGDLSPCKFLLLFLPMAIGFITLAINLIYEDRR